METDSVTDETQLQVKFITKQDQYAVSDTPYALAGSATPAELNTLVNSILHETHGDFKAVEFDFLVCGELLVGALGRLAEERGAGSEGTLTVEYLERFPAPSPQDCLMHDDWIADVHTHENWILTGCYDNSIHIWSTKGKHKLAIPGHTSAVTAVSWVSMVGQKAVFVSGAQDQSAMLWEWDMGKNSVECVVTCRGHDKAVDSMAVAADGTRFATGSWDTTIKLWSTSLADFANAPPVKKKSKSEHGKTREALSTLSGHREAVSGLVWIDHNTLLSSSWDHILKIWDCELGGIKQDICGNKAFFDVAWSPLNNSILTASADRHIRLYDPRSTESIVKTTFTSHTGWVQSVCWSTERDTLFLSGGYDACVKLWETRSPRTPLYELTGHEDKVLCCDWSNPRLLISGGCDNSLRLFKSRQALAAA